MRKFIALALLPAALTGTAFADDVADALPNNASDANVVRQVIEAEASPWTINDYVATARLEQSQALTLSSFSTEVLIDEAARRL